MTSATQIQKILEAEPWVDPYPEYNECTRCGISVGQTCAGSTGLCHDCYYLRPYVNDRSRTMFRPDFETAYFYNPDRSGLIVNTAQLRDAGLPTRAVDVQDDPVSHWYITDDLRYNEYPVTTITRGTVLLDSWQGMNRAKIRKWSAEATRQKTAANEAIDNPQGKVTTA
jgi:hypothetical protein